MAKKNNIIFIGEGGQGHEGKISNIKEYIRAASKTKFNFLKFHIIYADELATKDYKYYNFFKTLEFNQSQWLEASIYAKKNNVNLAFDVLGERSLKIAELCNSRLIKLHSTDIYNYALHKKINQSKIKNVLLSVSGCHLIEIKKAIHNLNKKKITLIYGYQNYPTLSKKLNLSKIIKLKNIFKFNLGYADHSPTGLLETIYNVTTAISYKANYIEKHFTFNNKKKVEDDESAIDVKSFNQLIDKVNLCKLNIGQDFLTINKEEKKYRKNVSRSIIAARDLKIGKKITIEDIILKRDKNKNKLNLKNILGFKTKKIIKQNQLIRKGSIKK